MNKKKMTILFLQLTNCYGLVKIVISICYYNKDIFFYIIICFQQTRERENER